MCYCNGIPPMWGGSSICGFLVSFQKRRLLFCRYLRSKVGRHNTMLLSKMRLLHACSCIEVLCTYIAAPPLDDLDGESLGSHHRIDTAVMAPSNTYTSISGDQRACGWTGCCCHGRWQLFFLSPKLSPQCFFVSLSEDTTTSQKQHKNKKEVKQFLGPAA